MNYIIDTNNNYFVTKNNSKINPKECNFMDAKVRIKQLMEKEGITEYRLAKLSGLSQSTISNIFNRNTAPTIPTIEAICNGLGISMAQFFSDDSENTVYLNAKRKRMFEDWYTLKTEHKELVCNLIEALKENY